MISIDPYLIDISIADHINWLREDGRLDAVAPESIHGHTCESVFGITSDKIAAVHIDMERSGFVRFLQLVDGRLISSDPAVERVMPPLPAKPH